MHIYSRSREWILLNVLQNYKTSFLLSTELELMLQTHTYMSSILISNFICEFRFHHHVWDTLHTLSTEFVCGSQIVGSVPLAQSPSQRTKGAHQPTISKRRSVYRHHFGVGRKEAVHQQVHSGIRVALLSKTSWQCSQSRHCRKEVQGRGQNQQQKLHWLCGSTDLSPSRDR